MKHYILPFILLSIPFTFSSIAAPAVMESPDGTDHQLVYDESTKEQYENRGYIEAEYTPASPSEIEVNNVGMTSDAVNELSDAILYQTRAAKVYINYKKGEMELPQRILQESNAQKVPFSVYVMDSTETGTAEDEKVMYSFEFLPGQSKALPDKTLNLGATVTTNDKGDISVTFDEKKDIPLNHAVNLHIPVENGHVYHTEYEGKDISLKSDYNEIVYTLSDFSDITFTYDRETDAEKDAAMPNYVAPATVNTATVMNKEVALFGGVGIICLIAGFIVGRKRK